MKNNITVVKANYSLLDIIKEEGFSLKQAGNNTYKMLCCFHTEKIPSLVVYKADQRFKCFGCGKSGDVIDFYTLLYNIDTKEAIFRLLDKSGFPTPKKYDQPIHQTKKRREPEEPPEVNQILTFAADYWHSQIFKNKEVIDYLVDKRGLTEEIIKEHKIGYAKGNEIINLLKDKKFSMEDIHKAGILLQKKGCKGYRLLFKECIIFPYIDKEKKEVVYLTSRGFPKKSHLKLAGRPCNQMYCENLNSDNRTIYITEGELDCLTLRASGLNAWGLPGAGSFKADWEARLNRFKIRYILLDNDDTGHNMSVKLVSKYKSEFKIVKIPKKSKDIEGIDI